MAPVWTQTLIRILLVVAHLAGLVVAVLLLVRRRGTAPILATAALRCWSFWTRPESWRPRFCLPSPADSRPAYPPLDRRRHYLLLRFLGPGCLGMPDRRHLAGDGSTQNGTGSAE